MTVINSFCIDIDNVVASTDAIIRRIICEFTNDRVVLRYEDITRFNYYECCDCEGNKITKDEWNQIHDIFSESKELESIELLPGAVEGVQQLSKIGEIHFATSRKRAARRATINWLDRHSFPDHRLHFVGHGEKHSALRSFTFAIEDHYEQAVSFAGTGTPCILIKHPWNVSRPEVSGVRWVSDWMALVQSLDSSEPK